MFNCKYWIEKKLNNVSVLVNDKEVKLLQSYKLYHISKMFKCKYWIESIE